MSRPAAFVLMLMLTSSSQLSAYCYVQDCSGSSAQPWLLAMMDVNEAIEEIQDESDSLKKSYIANRDVLKASVEDSRKNAAIAIAEFQLLSKIKGELEKELAYCSVESDGAILKAGQRLTGQTQTNPNRSESR